MCSTSRRASISALAPLVDVLERPEQRLLVEAVAAAGGDCSRVQALAGAVSDWSRAVELAAAHRIAALLEDALREAGASSAAAPAAAEALGAAARAERATDLMVRAQLLETGRCLTEAGVPFVLLKGAALGHTVYPPQLPRTMSDLDLLIARDELVRARTALEELGYRRSTTDEDDAVSYHSQMARAGQIVELHWQTTRVPPFFFDPAAAASRAERVEVGPGLTCRALAPLDLFVHLAFHYVFVNRFYNGLQGLLDLVLLWTRRADELPEGGLLSLARATRTAGAVYWGLTLLAEWLRLPVSERVLAGLRPPRWVHAAGARQVGEHFADAVEYLGGRPEHADPLDRLKWHLACTAAGHPRAAGSVLVYQLLRAPRSAPGVQLDKPVQRARFLVRRERWGRLLRHRRARGAASKPEGRPEEGEEAGQAGEERA